MMEKKTVAMKTPSMIAEENDCALIHRIASGTITNFEYLMEEIEPEETDLILIELVGLFGKGMYWEGVTLLCLAFGLRDMCEAREVVAAVGGSGDKDCMRMFLAIFLSEYEEYVISICDEHLSRLN